MQIRSKMPVIFFFVFIVLFFLFGMDPRPVYHDRGLGARHDGRLRPVTRQYLFFIFRGH
jgi:hypothetical protein